MEKKYKIKYLSLFYKDLDNITNYIKYQLKNEIVADNFVNKLEKEINQRAFGPNSYKEYTSARKRRTIYFRIYVDNYMVFYTEKDNTMEIRRLLYLRRNFDKLI